MCREASDLHRWQCVPLRGTVIIPLLCFFPVPLPPIVFMADLCKTLANCWGFFAGASATFLSASYHGSATSRASRQMAGVLSLHKLFNKGSCFSLVHFFPGHMF